MALLQRLVSLARVTTCSAVAPALASWLHPSSFPGVPAEFENARQSGMSMVTAATKGGGANASLTGRLRVAAVGDLHCKQEPEGALRALFTQASERADVLLLCGDLTDCGAPEEALVLAGDVAAGARIPVIGVLGNHDYESGKAEQVKEVLAGGGVRILDGGACEIRGVGFAGVKGFAGGFGERALGPWGEDTIKQFVREAVEEALKLESALGRLTTPRRIALLHYSPIEETLAGEAAVIFPFLGSSRLEEPLNRYGAVAVFHGHAHQGSLEGRTSTGIPVFNVSLPLLRERRPGEPPFRIVEVEAAASA